MATTQGTKTARPTHIPELLTIMFSFLDNRSLARAARVCSQWSDVALDTLWHTATDLRPLLSLLAPLTGEKKSVVMGRGPQYAYIVRPVPLRLP